MNVYPSQYQLPELTAHLVSLLERRRAGFSTWSSATEAALLAEARSALEEAGRQFREVADDPAYWAHTEETLLTVVVPRYFRLAEAQHALEGRTYDVWRGGDLLSRAAYALVGLVLGLIIIRTPIPDWLEPIPLLLFIFGPLFPDAQVGLARRKYRRQLAAVVEDMSAEQQAASAYRPLGIDEQAAAPDRVEIPRSTKERP